MATQKNTETARNKQAEEGDSPSGQKSLRELLEILRHPFVLLIIGATMTSLIVPYLNSKINRNQLLQEARLKKAVEIREHNTEFSSKLNALKTMLETFHNMNVRRLTCGALPKQSRKSLVCLKGITARRVLDYLKERKYSASLAKLRREVRDRHLRGLLPKSDAHQTSISTSCKTAGENPKPSGSE
jgi:heme exporter protein D